MKLTLQIQVFPDKEQAGLLQLTMERFNEVRSWLAARAFELSVANKIKLQRLFYYDLREKFGLSAQMAALCIRHVGGTYSRDKSIKPVFRKHAAMPYEASLKSGLCRSGNGFTLSHKFVAFTDIGNPPGLGK